KKRFIMMKNTKKGRVWETVFYSSAVLVTYFAFVGIEAQAAEIKYVEKKVSKVIENTVKEPEKALDVVVSAVSERVTEEVLILKYVEGQQYSGSFSSSSDKETYFYVVSSEKEVSIYNRWGVKQNNQKFSYKLEKIVEEERFKEELEKRETEELSRQLDTIEEQPKVYYKNNGFYSSIITIDEISYSYVVDGDKNVAFYDKSGKIVKIKESEYSLVDFKEMYRGSISSFGIKLLGIVNKETYTNLAKPLLIDEKRFQQELMEVVGNSIKGKYTEKVNFLFTLSFDIDSDGNVLNVQDLSEIPFPEMEPIKKYLYSQQKWQPSEKEEEKVTSTYKIEFDAYFNYSLKERQESRNNNKKRTSQ